MRHRLFGKLLPLSLTAIALLGLTAAACGDDDDDDTGGITPVATTASGGATTASGGATTASGGAASGAQKAEVTAKDFSFDPETISLKKSPAGAASSVTVTLDNQGRASHTWNLYTDEDFKSPVANASINSTPGGSSGTVTFPAPTEAKDYYFRCEIHTQMTGEIEFE